MPFSIPSPGELALAVVSFLVVMTAVDSMLLKNLRKSCAPCADTAFHLYSTSCPSALLGRQGSWGEILVSQTSVEILPVSSKRARISPKKENTIVTENLSSLPGDAYCQWVYVLQVATAHFQKAFLILILSFQFLSFKRMSQ